MKIRLGFVSNSSSSSFVCDVCGREKSGYDLCMSDIDMRECSHGHIFCTDHKEIILKDIKEIIEQDNTGNVDKKIKTAAKTASNEELEDIWEELINEWDDFNYECPPQACPICNFECFLDVDLINYLLKKTKRDRASVLTDIKSKFNNYVDFKNDLKK